MNKILDVIMHGFGINSVISSLSRDAEKLQKIINKKNIDIQGIDIEIEQLMGIKAMYQNDRILAKNILKDLLKYSNKKEE